MVVQSVSTDGAQIFGGYIRGKTIGKNDRNEGKINMFNPYGGLKNNKPLVNLKLREEKKWKTVMFIMVLFYFLS